LRCALLLNAPVKKSLDFTESIVRVALDALRKKKKKRQSRKQRGGRVALTIQAGELRKFHIFPSSRGKGKEKKRKKGKLRRRSAGGKGGLVLLPLRGGRRDPVGRPIVI